MLTVHIQSRHMIDIFMVFWGVSFQLRSCENLDRWNKKYRKSKSFKRTNIIIMYRNSKYINAICITHHTLVTVWIITYEIIIVFIHMPSKNPINKKQFWTHSDFQTL